MFIKRLTPTVTAVLLSPMPMSYRYQRWRNVGNKWNVGLALTRFLANALYLTFAPVVLFRESRQLLSCLFISPAPHPITLIWIWHWIWLRLFRSLSAFLTATLAYGLVDCFNWLTFVIGYYWKRETQDGVPADGFLIVVMKMSIIRIYMQFSVYWLAKISLSQFSLPTR